MKKTLTVWFWLGLLVAHPAWAFTNSFRAASADIVSGCSKVYDSTVGMTVLRCPSNAAGLAIIHAVMPLEATGPQMGIAQLGRFTPDVSPTGAFCDQVCVAIDIGGQLLTHPTDPGEWACTGYTDQNFGAQWALLQENFGNVGLTPHFFESSAFHVCGTGGGGPTECNLGELYIMIQRNPAGACVNGSNNNVDYTSITISFQ